jgi:hypothetical protein
LRGKRSESVRRWADGFFVIEPGVRKPDGAAASNAGVLEFWLCPGAFRRGWRASYNTAGASLRRTAAPGGHGALPIQSSNFRGDDT